MATIIINEDSKQAKEFIAFIKHLSFVKFVNEKKSKKEFNEETLTAMEEVRNGIGISKAENSADLFEKLGI